MTEAQRWALLLEYDGGPFVGWQRQATGLSIQQVLEEAAAHLNRGEPIASMIAGRTDAGVHAQGQVAHIDLLGPRKSGEADFKAPTVPGDYPFLCTFPAHYQTGMKGTLTVK